MCLDETSIADDTGKSNKMAQYDIRINLVPSSSKKSSIPILTILSVFVLLVARVRATSIKYVLLE